MRPQTTLKFRQIKETADELQEGHIGEVKKKKVWREKPQPQVHSYTRTLISWF